MQPMTGLHAWPESVSDMDECTDEPLCSGGTGLGGSCPALAVSAVDLSRQHLKIVALGKPRTITPGETRAYD